MVGEYYDWILEVSEFVMNFTNQHLWLGTDDHDWHTPLHVIIRPRQTANLRKRSAEAHARRQALWKARAPARGGPPPAAAVGSRWTPAQWREWQESQAARWARNP